MNKPEDKIEELFQSHINGFDKMPDDSLWDNIEANLPPVVTPNYKLWRWGLAAALLLFSLIGYIAYQSISKGKAINTIGVKGNNIKHGVEAQKLNNKKDTETASGAKENIETEKDATKESEGGRGLQINEINVADNTNRTGKIKHWNKTNARSENKASIDPKFTVKSTELIAHQNNIGNGNEDHKEARQNGAVQGRAIAIDEREKNKNKATEEKEIYLPIAETEKGMSERFTTPDYLPGHDAYLDKSIALNTQIAFESGYHPEKKKESFFKVPSEVYISFAPSLNYYRVFSNAIINQFNGASNGGRVGWAVQAGAVYPLKLRRLSYRVGISYFTAQSNFKYNLISGRQQPIRLNNNTFEYINIESTQAESKKWQLVELQNDLMYKIRPMQDLILGFKAGSSFTEKPVFDIYTGYRFSKQISQRQTMWIEAAYAYAVNAQQSSRNTFSYHMDKYSLRVGVNFR